MTCVQFSRDLNERTILVENLDESDRLESSSPGLIIYTGYIASSSSSIVIVTMVDETRFLLAQFWVVEGVTG